MAIPPFKKKMGFAELIHWEIVISEGM